MDILGCRWEERIGRDREGEKFHVWILISDRGRIVAKVICPLSEEYIHRVVFVLEPELDKEEYQFIDVESGQAFVEFTLERRNERKKAPTATS